MFRTIALSVRPGADFHVLDTLIQQLAPASTWVCEPSTPTSILPHLPRVPLSPAVDLVVVVGGDGTVLRIAPHAAQHNIPVIGIHSGRLGFLTDIAYPHAADRLQPLLMGQYRIEERVLLQAQSTHHPEPQWALNDVSVSSNTGHMVHIHIQIDRSFVWEQRADGVLAATPTGSTAYALSAGGPVVHPGVSALLLVPLCPHSLSSRPLLIPEASTVHIRCTADHDPWPTWYADGIPVDTLHQGDVLRLEAAPFKLRLLHPLSHDYFDVLREKLHWGHNPSLQAHAPCQPPSDATG